MKFSTLDDDGLITVSSDRKVQLRPYIPRKPKSVSIITDWELSNEAGQTLVFDTETYPNYHLIAFKNIRTGKYLKIDTFNHGMARKLSWIMMNYWCVGFNSLKYDLPLIWLAHKYALLGVDPVPYLMEASNKIIFGNEWGANIAKEYDFTIHKTRHIDLIEVCPLKGSLKLYGARLHAKRLQELPFDVGNNLSDDQKEIVADYCINDLDTTELLLNNLKEQLALRDQLSLQYRQDLLSKSDAQIAETVIGSEIRNITGKWPNKPKVVEEYSFNFKVPDGLIFQTDYMKGILNKIASAKFSLDFNGRLEVPADIKDLKISIGNGVYRMGIGGLHSSEECVAIKATDEYELLDRDVVSYYPMIVLSQNLCPTHIGQDFSTVYSKLVDRRIKAKRDKQEAISECLKITINGTFGKTGSPYSILYAPEMTIQITVGGQLYLLMLIEAMELSGIQVVSANTDGIVMFVGKHQKGTYNDIIKYWEQLTKFETEETSYSAVYSRDVNAYMAVKTDGKVKGKNIYYDPWSGKSGKDRYWRFQKNCAGQICVEAIEKLLTQNIPIEETIKACQDITRFVFVRNVKGGAHKDQYYLGKVIRYYYAKDVIGTINYIMNNNKVPDTEGAKACMDLPDTFPTDIDYGFYINRTRQMLEDMAYIERPKQLRLW